MVRIAHLSDIHVSAKKLEWQIQDFLNKRFAGWVNYRWLGRRHRFRHARRVLALLIRELVDRDIDHVVFSGDATALGFESELRVATRLLRVHRGVFPGGLAVPGNHDYATKAASNSGLFEKYFEPWQVGTRLDSQVYPFAQRVGDYWFVAVNSSKANRWAWDATGRIGADQIERFRRLLQSLPPGPRILVTHYPVCLATGKQERRFRRLRDLEPFLKAAAAGGVSLWLHGHRHRGYQLNDPAIAPFPIVCAGSATQSRIWTYCEYTLDGLHLCGVRRQFDFADKRFRDTDRFEWDLPVPTSIPRT